MLVDELDTSKSLPGISPSHEGSSGRPIQPRPQDGGKKEKTPWDLEGFRRKKTSGIQHLHGFWMILVDFNGFLEETIWKNTEQRLFSQHDIEGVWHRFSFEWCISVRFEVRRGSVRGTNFAPKNLRTFHQQGTPAGYWPSLNHCCQHQHRFGDNLFLSSCGKPKN